MWRLLLGKRWRTRIDVTQNLTTCRIGWNNWFQSLEDDLPGISGAMSLQESLGKSRNKAIYTVYIKSPTLNNKFPCIFYHRTLPKTDGRSQQAAEKEEAKTAAFTPSKDVWILGYDHSGVICWCDVYGVRIEYWGMFIGACQRLIIAIMYTTLASYHDRKVSEPNIFCHISNLWNNTTTGATRFAIQMHPSPRFHLNIFMKYTQEKYADQRTPVQPTRTGPDSAPKEPNEKTDLEDGRGKAVVSSAWSTRKGVLR